MAAAALIRPLARELLYAMGAALERKKEREEGREGEREGGRKEGRKKKRKEKKKNRRVLGPLSTQVALNEAVVWVGALAMGELVRHP